MMICPDAGSALYGRLDHEFSAHRRCPFTERLDRVCFSESVETCEQANMLTTGKFGLGRAPTEEQAIQFTVPSGAFRLSIGKPERAAAPLAERALHPHA
jgi:hypothetical protein